MTLLVNPEEKVSSVNRMSKNLDEFALRLRRLIQIPNMMSPLGPRTKEWLGGSISFSVSIEEVMISFLIVSRPSVKKRDMKMVMTASDKKPPVAVLY